MLIKHMSYLLLCLSTLIFASCSSDVLEMGPNGDSRLREIAFKDRTLVPSFSPTITDYSIYKEGKAQVIGKVIPYMFHTKFTLNGSFVRMQTNGYRLPDYTDLTKYFTNDVLVIDLVAQDGNKRKYTVRLLNETSESGLSAISSLDALFKSAFVESKAPMYKAGSLYDEYVFAANTNTIVLTVSKVVANSSVTATGNATPQASSSTATLIFSGLGTGSVYYITNISSDGSTTNIKKLIGYYLDPANDARMTSLNVSVNGNDVPYLPKFNYDGFSGSVLVIDSDKMSLSGSLQFSDTTLSVLVNDIPSSIPVVRDGKNFTLRDITVSQGDIVTLRTVKGTKTIDYKLETRLFTQSAYNFDGGIQNVIRDVYMYKEMKTCNYTISGVVTFITDYDETAKAGWFIEDGAYGLYVWSWNGWKTGVKVGHKIKLKVSAAKVWMNMPEVTDADAASTEILENGKRYPLHYINGNEMEFGQFRHLGRIMRYSTYDARVPIAATYDDNGMGNFDPNKAFKLFIPYTKSLSDLQNTYKPESLVYMTEGKQGIFFGPSFLDGDGASIMMKGKEYMIVP